MSERVRFDRVPRGYLLGFGLVAVAVLLFGWLAHGVTGERWREWDGSVTRSHNRQTAPGLLPLATALTWLGDAEGVAVVVLAAAVVFLARRRYVDTAGLLAVVTGVMLIEVVLKPLFAVARPNALETTIPGLHHSFPSGHAMRGVGMFGYLAAVSVIECRCVWWRWVLATAFMGLAVGVCWSRVYLGWHWATDVIAGGLAAGAWLVACLIGRHYAMTRPRRNTPAQAG